MEKLNNNLLQIEKYLKKLKHSYRKRKNSLFIKDIVHENEIAVIVDASTGYFTTFYVFTFIDMAKNDTSFPLLLKSLNQINNSITVGKFIWDRGTESVLFCYSFYDEYSLTYDKFKEIIRYFIYLYRTHLKPLRKSLDKHYFSEAKPLFKVAADRSSNLLH